MRAAAFALAIFLSASPLQAAEPFVPQLAKLVLPGTERAPDDYLCDVYHRLMVKSDHSGDFTWKDYSASAKLKMDVCAYAVNGMHPDLREALFHFGREADARGVRWTILSGFRDNYRQRIASGFKARECCSRHGGNRVTKGYGDGRAIDIWADDGCGNLASPDALWSLMDTVGKGLGLVRTIKGRDPAHVELRPVRIAKRRR